MNTLEIRATLHQRIDELDEKFLRAVYAMVETYAKEEDIIGYDLDGQPIFTGDLERQIEAGEEQVKEGKYYSLEVLKQEIQTWRSAK